MSSVLTPASQELGDLIKQRYPEFTDQAQTQLVGYYELVLDENQRQNLTRLTTPQAFCDGHVADAVHLLKSKLLTYPAMDLGSGVGVPGIIACLLEPQTWILCESEKRKAAFLNQVVERLHLQDSVRVYAGRGESYLKHNRVASIVSRAVGSLEKHLNWFGSFVTWDQLLLMKGPGWSEERKEVLTLQLKYKFQIKNEWVYKVDEAHQDRTIAQVVPVRVMRGLDRIVVKLES